MEQRAESKKKYLRIQSSVTSDQQTGEQRKTETKEWSDGVKE
jgi:hypothetical protein